MRSYFEELTPQERAEVLSFTLEEAQAQASRLHPEYVRRAAGTSQPASQAVALGGWSAGSGSP